MIYSVKCFALHEILLCERYVMFVKAVKEVSLLLDFYEELLSERKRTVLSMYYNEDLSLAEIADEIGISRQGVRDLIKKAEEELNNLEDKLGLVRRFEEAKARAATIREMLEKESVSPELAAEFSALTNLFL